MKRFFILFIATSTAAPLLVGQSAAQEAQHDKAFLLNYCQQTYDDLENAVAGLSEEQLKFKSAPDRWSISQCLEHIILTEKMLLGFNQETLSQAPNPERRNEVKLTDEDIINGITDRSFKAQASKELTPAEAGKYTDAAVALAELRSQRTVLIDYINSLSEEDMRNRVTDSPFGPVDGYHSLLYIPGHTARHTLQIAEVKADAHFPKDE
ncbi:DinB family protein [Parapedobacter koreensis]|uniref:DinB superfamily protein n=1 Tax=Parapedobacter koreensis TaxID=332977 RepID=A0A1H7EVV2_9SPHI|nr:DinB family protein [Parapedobacter koreensis]SEK18036.1 DinB superfamily protein [Parapedobacter koreensis]